MNNYIFICSYYAAYIEYVRDNVKRVLPDATIVGCNTQRELYERISFYKNVFIICDTFFFGLILKPKLSNIKNNINPDAKIMITSWNSECYYFGLRIANLGFDGYYNLIGDAKSFGNALSIFFSKGSFFDDFIKNDAKNQKDDDFEKSIADVRTDEINFALSFMKSGYPKSKKTAKAKTSDYKKMSIFRRKLGVVNNIDMTKIVSSLLQDGLL